MAILKILLATALIGAVVIPFSAPVRAQGAKLTTEHRMLKINEQTVKDMTSLKSRCSVLPDAEECREALDSVIRLAKAMDEVMPILMKNGEETAGKSIIADMQRRIAKTRPFEIRLNQLSRNQ